LQATEDIHMLVRQLKPVLSSILEQARIQFNNLLLPVENYIHGKQAIEAYSAWQALSNGTVNNRQEEFCLQTTYLQFVRTLFIRACEDHGLIPYVMADGNLTTTIKDTYLSLLKKLYSPVCSDNHFGIQDFFDWFTPDTQSLLSLLHLLRCYDFKDVSIDVLGRIYDEGYIENKGRSEKGQFYTPIHVVEYMLDTLDMPGCDTHNCNGCTKDHTFLEKTVGDISCGSGSFLMAVAARKRAVLQHLVAAHKVSPEYALQIMSNTLLGFDLNPFACYVAEINLLVQCLPFLVDEQGQLCRNVEQLHIYCTDVLEPASGKLINLSEGYQGIDYLVGNPPYVSAGESSENLRYREKISESGIYQLLHQRWDLFVPFFERNLQFLRPGTGRLGLIVSNGIETEGYAERLRQALSKNYSLLQIDFFPGLRLFQDAAVENTIVLVENHLPDEKHAVSRRRHQQPDCKHFETLPPLPQLATNGQIFRWRYDPILNKSMAEGTIPLCALVYIGTGVEAQSDEDSDPIIEGKRQKRYTLNDVFLPPSLGEVRPSEYTDDGVLGDDVDRYYLRRKRFVAYEKFRPYMRGPRHVALFRTTEKLLLGETSGGYYDREGLFANHSVQVVVSWKALEEAGAIEEKGIRRVLRKSLQIAGISADLASISDRFDLRYVLGIVNSRFMRAYITSNMHEGTRKGRIYPDVWKRLPIKVASLERQQQIAGLVEVVQEGYRQVDILRGDEREEMLALINSNLMEIEGLVEDIYGEHDKA
jgi:type I restriction-modification system DNA methylase subunit